MKVIFFLLILSFSFILISCNNKADDNPVDISLSPMADTVITVTASVADMEIEFKDSCSYSFIMNFLSGYDTVKIENTFLGSTFYVYADSGDGDYWQYYFQNDSTIQDIFGYKSADSLILKIKLSGIISEEEEIERFSNIKHLKIINIERYPKLVYIDVPKGTETYWKTKLEQNSFVEHVYIIYIFTDI